MIANHRTSSAVEQSDVATYYGRSPDDISHEEIVMAAKHHFMENGYDQTSIETVAREVGVPVSIIYNHFADKRDLFRAIIQHCYDKVGMPHSYLSEANLPAKEVLLKIARQFVSNIYQTDSILLIRAVRAEAMRDPEILLIYFEEGQRPIKSALAALLREFNHQGQLSVPDPVRAAEQFFSLLTGEMLQKILALPALRPDSEELGVRVKTTVDIFLAYYRPHVRTKNKGA